MKADGSQQTWSGNNQDDPNVFGKYDSTTISQDQTKYPHWVDGVNWYDWLTRAGQGGKTFTTNNPEYANSTATYIEITGANNLSAQDFFVKANLLWNAYQSTQGYFWAYGGNNLPNAHGGSCTTPSTGVMDGPNLSTVGGHGFVIGGNASYENYHYYYRGAEGAASNGWTDFMGSYISSEPDTAQDFTDFFRGYVQEAYGTNILEGACDDFVTVDYAGVGTPSATWLPANSITYDAKGDIDGIQDTDKSANVTSWNGQTVDSFERLDGTTLQWNSPEVDYGWRIDEAGTKLKAKYRGYGFTGCPCETFVTNWATTARTEAFQAFHDWIRNAHGYSNSNPVLSLEGLSLIHI